MSHHHKCGILTAHKRVLGKRIWLFHLAFYTGICNMHTINSISWFLYWHMKLAYYKYSHGRLVWLVSKISRVVATFCLDDIFSSCWGILSCTACTQVLFPPNLRRLGTNCSRNRRRSYLRQIPYLEIVRVGLTLSELDPCFI